MVKNSLLEAFVIHARGLIMFLYGTAEYPDDVVASDFFDGGEWEARRPAMTAPLGDALKRANKEVAHITTFRVGKRLEDKQWKHLEIAEEVFRALRVFFALVPSNRMPPAYREWYGKAELRIVRDSAVADTTGRSS